MVRTLKISFCSYWINPRDGIEQKLRLTGQVRFEIDQRGKILTCHAQARLQFRQQPIRSHLLNEPDNSL